MNWKITPGIQPTDDGLLVPLGELLDEANNKTPEPDHMQWQQPVEVLLGRGTPNQGPTQDWEFDLINQQVAGNLDRPAYKNLTPEIIQLAAEKGTPAGSQTDAAPADGQGAASAPSTPATPASPGPLVRAAQSYAQRRHAQRDGVTGGKPSLGATPTPIDFERRERSRHGTGIPKALPPADPIQIPPQYQQIAADLGVDIDKNYRDAQRLGSRFNVGGFVDSVGSNTQWDYKNHADFDIGERLDGKYPDKLRDDFGNWHFGVMANGFGWNLETSMLGAGAYQVFKQPGGDVPGFAKGALNWAASIGGLTQDDQNTANLTRGGMSWGDNPGDSVNILEGWKDGQKALK